MYDTVIIMMTAIWSKFHFVQPAALGRIRELMKLAWTDGKKNNVVPFEAGFP